MTGPVLERMKSRVRTVGALLGFLWEARLWWLIPLVVTLVAVGAVLVIAEGSAMAPFIYTLF